VKAAHTLRCPKCRAYSGDDWSQCKGKCPVEQSPYFDKESLAKYGPLRDLKSKPPTVKGLDLT